MDPWVCMFSLFLPLLSAKNYEQKSVKIKKNANPTKKKNLPKENKNEKPKFLYFYCMSSKQ